MIYGSPQWVVSDQENFRCVIAFRLDSHPVDHNSRAKQGQSLERSTRSRFERLRV